MNKILVAYFSASGTTARMARQLAHKMDADLYPIELKVPYTNRDLNWMNPFSRCSKEHRGKKFPELKDRDANIREYDFILVGYPIWWYKAPVIINAFLENYDFSNKTILPFATSGGSGIGDAEQYLRKSLGASVKIKMGKLLNQCPSEKEIQEWIRG